MSFSKSLIITAIAALAPIAMQASPVTTTSTLSVGGLNFSNFGCSITNEGKLVFPDSCGDINVAPLSNSATGIEFNSGFAAANNAFSDVILKYSVSGSPISSVGLSFDGEFLGEAISSVTESVYDGNTLIKSAFVSCSPDGCNQSDNIDLGAAYTNLNIVKDVQMTAGKHSVAEASYIDQSFSDAPEPGTTALMGLGLLAGVAVLRRRSPLAGKKA